MRVEVCTGEPFPAARVFESESAPADPDVLDRFCGGLAGVDLASPAVVLPDFHHKPSMEMPSSIAVATERRIYPTFSSASVNCGMALIALDTDVPDARAIAAFFEGVRARFPYPARTSRELSHRDVLRAAVDGAAFAVERFGLEEEALERIEHDGRIDTERWGGEDRIRRDLPWLSRYLGRLRFGTVGPSNHFVEVQRVEEILDPDAAARLGIAPGQMTIQFHAGGGVLASQVGRLFVRRKKMTRPMRVQMAVQRPLYHLGSSRSPAQARERVALYFRHGTAGIPRAGIEGARLMAATAAAMNYGFAFRAATYSSLIAIARDAFGIRGARLVVDSPHNSIYEEEIDGRSVIVHRHNSCRAFPAERMRPGSVFASTGQAVLLPGTCRTSSYLCVADHGAERSLFSASHGAGTLIDDSEKRGRSRLHPLNHQTLAFAYDGNGARSIAHLDDAGIDAGLEILSANRIVRPVARMRPMAVLR